MNPPLIINEESAIYINVTEILTERANTVDEVGTMENHLQVIMPSAKLMDSVLKGWMLWRGEGRYCERRVPRPNILVNIEI